MRFHAIHVEYFSEELFLSKESFEILSIRHIFFRFEKKKIFRKILRNGDLLKQPFTSITQNLSPKGSTYSLYEAVFVEPFII